MVKIFNHYVSKLVSALLIIEIFALIFALYGAHDVLVAYGYAVRELDQGFFASASAFSLITIFSMAAFGLYHLEGKPTATATASRLVPSAGLGFVITGILFRVVPELYFDLRVLSVAAAGGGVAILLLRTLIFRTFELSFLESRVIFVGEGALAKECSTLAVDTIFPKKYNIVGFVPTRTEERAVASSAILPAGESLFTIAKRSTACAKLSFPRRTAGAAASRSMNCSNASSTASRSPALPPSSNAKRARSASIRFIRVG
jgi:hypothetical protein